MNYSSSLDVHSQELAAMSHEDKASCMNLCSCIYCFIAVIITNDSTSTVILNHTLISLMIHSINDSCRWSIMCESILIS